MLARAASLYATRDALVDERDRLTYSGLAADVEMTARALVASGVQPGDRVAIWAPNTTEWAIAALAIYSAGAVLVPLNTRFKGAEAAYILDRADVRLLFTVTDFLATDYVELLRTADPVASLKEIVVLRGKPAPGTVGWKEFLERADRVIPEELAARRDALTGDDLSDILFTSGTTGRPKGAMLTHGASVRAYEAWSDVVGPARGRPLPRRQPVLPRVRAQGRDPREHPEGRDDHPARGVRRRRGDGARPRSTCRCCPGRRRSTSRSSTTPRSATSTCRRCGSR